jgi:hypothetical protein
MVRRLEKAKNAAPDATATEAPKAAGVRAIFSPTLDFLCIGGIGICALAAIALSPQDLASYAYWPAMILGLQIVQLPHFIASYRLLYQSKRLLSPWASIYHRSCSVHICYFHWFIQLCSASRSTK